MYNFKKDLKKCPFCGGTAYLKKGFGLFGLIGYYIECQKCKARTRHDAMSDSYIKVKDGKLIDFYTRNDNDVVNSLVAKWNSRI